MIKQRVFPVALLATAALLVWVTPVTAGEPVVVQHGRTVITKEDVRRFVELRVPEERRAQLMANEKQLRDLIAKLFLTRKMAENASDLNLTDEDKWRLDFVRDQMLAEHQIERVVQKAEKPDLLALAREAYQAEAKRFIKPEQVRVEHILISTKKRSDEEAKKLVAQVLDEVKQGKRAFTELAKEYSEDSSAKTNSGDLGFFAKGRMVKPFEEAAFGMTALGEVSGPVKTSFGYHILRFIERQPEVRQTFEEVKDVLLREQEQKFRQRAITDEYARLGKLTDTLVNQQAIAELGQRPEMKGPDTKATPQGVKAPPQ